jgi:hypothetical protein
MRRAAFALLVGAAGAAAIAWSLPAPVVSLAAAPDASVVRGAIHVHTRRSDGSGTHAEIAAAAARAGLQFVVITDHDDGAAEPVAPFYEDGVLLIEGVEISTDHGHVVALGLPRAPYPLGGEGRDVVADIARLGGMSIAAHPASPRGDARWTEWSAPFDGLEWLNADSEWRDERGALARALFTYPFRPRETLAQLLDRPDGLLQRWDVLSARRPVVAIAAVDAHARVPLRGEGQGRAVALRVPSYESMFRGMSIGLPGVSFTGDAAADGRAALDAIRRGRVYTTIDGLATPGWLSFTAVSGSERFTAGDVVRRPVPLDLQVESNAPAGARIVLLKNGAPEAEASGAMLRHRAAAGPAVYRVEVYLPDAPGAPPVPWMLSNPIYAGVAHGEEMPQRPPATDSAVQYDNGQAEDWTVNTSPRSQAALDVLPLTGDRQLSMRWALGGTRSESPYAALVMPAGPALTGYDRLTFTAGADRPMRLSVQLHVPTDKGDERWARSVYLDEAAREITVFFDEMTPRGLTSQRRPVLGLVRSVLFVVDTVNTAPGTAGQFWIDDVAYGR